MNKSRDPYSITGYSRLAIRLEHDLSQTQRGSNVLIMAADFERVAVESTTELAWHLAEDLGLRVLMVDASFNDSGLTKVLGGADKPGMMDLLTLKDLSEDAIIETMQSTSHERILFIPTGQGDQSGSAPARSSRLKEFLSIVNSMADFVLIQGPAVNEATRTLAFSPLVDAVLLITLEGQLEVSHLEDAQKILSDSGAEKVGLVIGVSRNTNQQD